MGPLANKIQVINSDVSGEELPGRRCHVTLLSQEGQQLQGEEAGVREGGRRLVEGVVSGQRESRRADQSEEYALKSPWHLSDPWMSPGRGRLQGTRLDERRTGG